MSDEDTEELNTYEDIKCNEFQKNISDTNLISNYRFQESFKSTEQ